MTLGDLSVGSLNANDITLPFLSNGVLSDIIIESCTINNSSIGSEGASSGNFTTLITGEPGVGYDVLFNGSTPNNFMQWDASTNTLNIDGSINITGPAVFSGNLRLINNDIVAINTDGNINLKPNGSGITTIQSPLTQFSSGPVSFTNTGIFSSTASKILLTSTLDSSITTGDGNLTFTTDSGIIPFSIISITNLIGTGVQVTTNTSNNLNVGDLITITSSNSFPSINGIRTILSKQSANQFCITTPTSVFVPGYTGTITRIANHSIILNPAVGVNLTQNKPFNFGSNSYISGSDNTGLTFGTSSDITLGLSSGHNLIIPSGTGLQFINTPDTNRVYVDENGLNLSSTKSININSDLYISDPVITIGSVNNIDDRGIDFLWSDGINSFDGFFGYQRSSGRFVFIPKATNTIDSETFTGDYGDFQMNDVYCNTVKATNAYTNSLYGDPDLFLNATRYIYLNAGSAIKIPDKIPIQFSSTCSISESSDNLYLNSSNIILPLSSNLVLDENLGNKKINSTLLGLNIISDFNIYLSTASGSIYIPQNINLTFGLGTQNISGSGGELNIYSGNNISLNPSAGHILIPTTRRLVLGNSNDYIFGNNGISINTSNTLTCNASSIISLVTSSSIKLTSGTNIIIPTDIPIIFGDTGNYIMKETDDLYINSSTGNVIINSLLDIDLNATSSVNIPLGIPIQFGNPNQFISSNSTNLIISNTSGNINISSSKVIINGELDVQGSITYIESAVTVIIDPYITLGISNIDDNKDRGISFNWNTLGTSKIGFFGYKDDSKRFKYIPDAINTNGVFTGLAGDIDAGDIYCNNLYMTSGGSVGIASFTGNPDLTFTARSIYMTASTSILIPINTLLQLGGVGNNIYNNGSDTILNNTGNFISNSIGNYNINSTIINLNPTSYVTIPNEIPLVFGSITENISSSSGNLILTSSKNIDLSPSTGSVNIPNNILLYLGTSSIKEGSTGDLNINSATSNINLTGSSIILPINNTPLVFGSSTSNNIKFDGTNLDISSSGIVSISPGLSVTGNIGITGSITSGSWNGTTVSETYGGTGKTSWIQGSVVFAGNSILAEDNVNFFWDNTNKKLGIGLNSNIPHSLTIRGDQLGFIPRNEIDIQGPIYKNTVGSYNIHTYRKSTGSNYNADYIIATGNETDYTLLKEQFCVRYNGFVGIGFTSISDITESLYVKGNELLTGSLKFSDTEYINDISGVLTLTGGGVISLNPVTSVNINNDIPIKYGDNTSISGNNGIITIIGYTNISLSSPIINIPTDSSLYLGTVSYLSGNTDLTLFSSGNINLDSSSNIIVNNPILFGSTTQSIGVINGNLVLGSIGEILLNGTSVNLIDGTSLYLGSSSLSETTTIGGLNINSTQINLQDNVPMVFGDYSRRIVSDGTKLHIYGADISLDGNVEINGNLTLNGQTIQGGGGNTGNITIGNIIPVGGQQILNITSIVNSNLPNTVILFTNISHNLINGDTVIITGTNSDPIVDGTYIITVLSSSSFSIIKSGGVVVTGDTGIMSSALIADTGKDLGFQFNYHLITPIGTSGARYGFSGFKRSTERFTFIHDGTNVNDVFSGNLGDIECSSLYCTTINGFTAGGNIVGGAFNISSSNFTISGGSIDGTPIGNTTTSSGKFTSITGSSLYLTGDCTVLGNGGFNSLSVTSNSLVTNLNSDLLDSKRASDFIWVDGSKSLSANWNSGIFDIKSKTFTSTSLATTGTIVFTNNTGTLINSSSLVFDNSTNTLNTTNIGAFNSTGNITNVSITSGSISGTNITIGINKTLDVSAGTLTLADGQINGSKISGGTADISISGNAYTVTNGIYKGDFNSANTILKADTANIPIPLIVGTNTIVGNINGTIQALSASDVQTIIGVPSLTEASISNASGLTTHGPNNLLSNINYSFEEIFCNGGDDIDIDLNKNISFINVDGIGIVTSTLGIGSISGQFKQIIFTSITPGTTFHLILNTGVLETPDGNLATKTMIFDQAGMSIHLVYYKTLTRWFLVPGGCLF